MDGFRLVSLGFWVFLEFQGLGCRVFTCNTIGLYLYGLHRLTRGYLLLNCRLQGSEIQGQCCGIKLGQDLGFRLGTAPTQ